MARSRNGMCEVCGTKPKEVVCSSILGPVSFGYCKDCMLKNREPYDFLVTTLILSAGIKKYEDLPDHDGYILNKSFVDNILHYENKSVDDFNLDMENENERLNRIFEEEAMQDSYNEPVEVKAVCVDDEQVEFEYCDVVKMQPTTKKFSLSKGELKFIVDSLEDFTKSMETVLLDENLTAYNRALLGVKINQSNKISEKIKNEIDYCAKCNKKQREETGLSGLEAAVNGVK